MGNLRFVARCGESILVRLDQGRRRPPAPGGITTRDQNGAALGTGGRGKAARLVRLPVTEKIRNVIALRCLGTPSTSDLVRIIAVGTNLVEPDFLRVAQDGRVLRPSKQENAGLDAGVRL